MKSIKRLLDECQKQGPDLWGFINHIPKELIDDASKEYREISRQNAKRARSGSVHSTST